MASRKSIAAAVGAVIVVVAGAAWWYRASSAGAEAAAKAARGAAGAPTLVTTAVALKQDIPVEVNVNGNVVSLNTVDIKPQVSNVVQKVHVKEGDVVRAGQLLFTL